MQRAVGANPTSTLIPKTKKPLSQTPMETHLFEVTPQMGSESDLTAFTCLGFHTLRANYKHNFLRRVKNILVPPVWIEQTTFALQERCCYH